VEGEKFKVFSPRMTQIDANGFEGELKITN